MKYHFIHERGNYQILAVEEIGSVWSGDIKRSVACGDSPLYFIYKNGRSRIFGSSKCNKKNANFIFNKTIQDRKYVGKIKNIFISSSKVFLNFIKILKAIDFKKLSNQELILLKEKYIRFYHQTAPYGEPLPFFLKEKLQQILDDYLINHSKVSYKDYQLLIQSSCPSFFEQEKKELFNSSKKAKNSKQLNNLIKKHAEKYGWIIFDYASLVADDKYFKELLSEIKKQKIKFTNYQIIKKKKIQLIKKYKINNFYQYYLKILDDLYFLMNYKKEVLSRCHFAITPLYKEAAKRIGLNLNQAYWLSWQELKGLLIKKNKLSRKIINQRKKNSVGKFVKGKIKFLSEKNGFKIISEIAKEENIQKKTKEIKGISASGGIVLGRVRYLKSASECDKMKNGEILLVSNTTPDFMPAIRKAKAIITNEGGITCHAAIISRELKIPCVVGTKIGTQIFKTGDLVEVNANKGIIRKIK